MSTAFEGFDKGSIVTPRARSANRQKYQLVINLKTVKTLGLKVPSMLFAIAPGDMRQATP